MSNEDKILVGQFSSPVGLKGEIKVNIMTTTFEVFKKLQTYSNFDDSIKWNFERISLRGDKCVALIENCFSRGVNKINIITGKGLRSKNIEDPYKSNNLSILKYSVPDFIKNNTELMSKIFKIDLDSVNSPSKGSFDIILKKRR